MCVFPLFWRNSAVYAIHPNWGGILSAIRYAVSILLWLQVTASFVCADRILFLVFCVLLSSESSDGIIHQAYVCSVKLFVTTVSGSYVFDRMLATAGHRYSGTVDVLYLSLIHI